MTLPVSHRSAAVAAALLCAAAPLRAQRTLLPLSTLPDGSAVALDSASVWRTGDSTFEATTVYHFAAPVSGADRREENGEVDCAQPRRGARSISLMLGDSVVQTTEEAGDQARWSPVADADLPVHRALCSALLGSWAAALPRTYLLSEVDRMPALVNARDVERSLPREFPPAERDAGISGRATIRALVLPDGRVERSSIRVVNMTAAPFAAAATRVVAGMRFHPAQLHGRPVPAWITLPVTFDFKDGD